MIIERQELRKVLTQAKKAQGRSSIEVLQGIRIRTTDEGVCFETTDMDVYAVLHPVCESVSNLDAVVELAVLARIAKDIPYRRVSIEQAADGTLAVYNYENGETPIALPSRSVEDWPARPDPQVKDAKCVCVLTLNELAAVRHSIIPAASKDESRPVLTQVQLDVNGRVRFASTDSYRLHMLDMPEAVTLMDGTAILSARLLRIAYDVANHYDAQPITITCGERFSTVSVDGEDLLTCRTVDGQYPQVDKLMPDYRASSRIVKVQREPLIEALKMAAIDTAKGKPVGIRVTLVGIDVVSMESAASFPVPVVSNVAGPAGGSDIDMGVNADFLIGALDALDTVEATITFINPLKPFTVVGKDVCCLVMPVRLQGEIPGKAQYVAMKGGSKPVAEVVAEARKKRDASAAVKRTQDAGRRTPTRAKDLPPARFATAADKLIDKYKGDVQRMKYAKQLRAWHLGERKTKPQPVGLRSYQLAVNTEVAMSKLAIECGIHKIGGKNG